MRNLRTLAAAITRPSNRRWAAILAVPLLLLGLLAFAFHDPMAYLGRVDAAVVNNDEPVTVNGQTTPLGRELAASLVNNDDPDFNWILTNSDDARQGLDSGDYKVVVTIPKNFSKDATSIGSVSAPDSATEANINIQSASNIPLLDSAMGRVLADAAKRSLSQQLTETYLANIYSSLNSMHGQLSSASTNTAKLAKGADSLASGAKQAKTGTASLASGANQLATNTATLARGADQLNTGAATLSSGLNQLKTSTSTLPSQAKRLASGSQQVAQGTQQVQDTVVPLTNGVTTAINNSPDARTKASELSGLVSQCDSATTPAFCQKLTNLSTQVTQDATRIETAKSDAKSKASQAGIQVKTLNSGAQQVAQGNAQLAGAAGQLTTSVSQLATGGSQLASSTEQLDSGAQQLKGATSQASSAAKQLDSAMGQLSTGATTLQKGTHQLSDGLSKAVKQVPNYSQSQSDHLKSIVAAPVATQVIGTDGYTSSAMALFAMIALWAGALTVCLIWPVMSRDVTVSNLPTWRLSLKGSGPRAIVGVTQAIVVALILSLVLDLTVATFCLLLAACLLSSAVFMLVNRALVAGLGDWGRTISVIVVILAGATAVTSAQPAVLTSIARYLPTYGPLSLLRLTSTGTTSGLAGACVVAALWGAIALAAVVWLTERARQTPVQSLRPRPPMQWVFPLANRQTRPLLEDRARRSADTE